MVFKMAVLTPKSDIEEEMGETLQQLFLEPGKLFNFWPIPDLLLIFRLFVSIYIYNIYIYIYIYKYIFVYLYIYIYI